MRRTTLDLIRVHRSPRDPRRGILVAGALVLPCALGHAGLTRAKREGDGASPVGRFRLLGGLYRPDRLPRPCSRLRLRALRRTDGWCDDPADRRYNQPVRLPDPARHERLWRADALYDLVLDIGWNRGPIRPGRGSAIFLHVAQPVLLPTEGCVAVPRAALRRLVARLGPQTRIEIMP